MSCNILCPCISSGWEQYSKIIHNIHFDHVIWHHNAFCNIFVWKLSLLVCCDILRLSWTWFLYDFLLNLCFFEPTWPFYLKFNLSKTIYFLKRTWFLYVLSKYQGMFKGLQWNAMLRKTPTLKIARSSPRNSVCIGHASNPP